MFAIWRDLHSTSFLPVPLYLVFDNVIFQVGDCKAASKLNVSWTLKACTKRPDEIPIESSIVAVSSSIRSESCVLIQAVVLSHSRSSFSLCFAIHEKTKHVLFFLIVRASLCVIEDMLPGGMHGANEVNPFNIAGNNNNEAGRTGLNNNNQAYGEPTISPTTGQTTFSPTSPPVRLQHLFFSDNV